MTEYPESTTFSIFVKDLCNSRLLRRTWVCKCHGDRMSLIDRASFVSKFLSGTDPGFGPAGGRRMEASNNLKQLNPKPFPPDLSRGSRAGMNDRAISL